MAGKSDPSHRPAPHSPERSPSRAAPFNPPNRFEPLHLDFESECDPDPDSQDRPTDRTIYLRDHAQSLITFNDSPDVGFDAGINVYRGCEHGCIYCYARPTHEFLGFSSGLDFEQTLMVKTNAPELLRNELGAKSWRPQVLAMSGITDPYQPVERKLQLTRRCLAVLAEFRNPVGIITKNQLVTRDLDLLRQLNDYSAVAVYVSITTLDPALRRVMEPRTAPPDARLRTIERLAREGIPVGTLVAPIIPGLTDHEIPNIISRAREAGAQFAGHVVLRLPYQVKELFDAWLDRHFPDKKTRVINRLKAIRDGTLNTASFGSRMAGKGIFADQIHQMFQVSCRKAGLLNPQPHLTVEHFRRYPDQLDLFANPSPPNPRKSPEPTRPPDGARPPTSSAAIPSSPHRPR